MNFLPLVYEELQNMSAECDEKLGKSELIQGGGNITYMRVGAKLLSKNITKR